MSNGIAIVGDVHGDLTKLERVFERYVDRRQIVLVGDYVNRGPDSAGVLEFLCNFHDREDIHPLMGNHDHALLEFLNSGDIALFSQYGGLSTIRSYTPRAGGNLHRALLDKFPDSHTRFLTSLKSFFEAEDLLVSHCGAPPTRELSRSFHDMVLSSHPGLFKQPPPPLTKYVVSGHYVQQSGAPYISERYCCIDTGCGTIRDAPLTVLEWPERTPRQIG
jgi:serine/threonine protein phosphatase 1